MHKLHSIYIRQHRFLHAEGLVGPSRKLDSRKDCGANRAKTDVELRRHHKPQFLLK